MGSPVRALGFTLQLERQGFAPARADDFERTLQARTTSPITLSSAVAR
jgi:hypothetical protein